MKSPKVIMLLDNPFVNDDRVEKEATSLLKAGYDLQIIASIEDGLPEEEIQKGILVKRWIDTKQLIKPFSKQHDYCIKELAKRIIQFSPDILHSHDYLTLKIGVEVKKQKQSIKLIYDTHEYLPGYKVYKGSKSFFNKLKGYLVWLKELRNEKKNILLVDKVLTVSSAIADELKKKYNLEREVVVINNYTMINRSIKLPSLRDKLNISVERLICVLTGNIYVPYNLLEKWFGILKERKCSVVVFGNKKEHKELREFLEKNNELKEIYFFDYLTQEERVAYFSSADIAILPLNTNSKSQTIASPNRLFEYISAGLPILSSSNEVARAIKFSGFPIEITDNEPKNFEEKLNKLMAGLNMKKRKAFQMRDNYTWKNEEPKLLKLYNELLN